MNVISLPTAAIEIKDGHPVTSSLRIAEVFGKDHAKVLRDIRNILAQVPESFGEANFGLAEYLDAQGKPRPAYDLSRDGFALLAMGFTGPEALAFKLAYIERFNAMEADLGSGRNFGLAIPPTMTLGEYLVARDYLKDLRVEFDRLYGQFKAAKIEVTHDEIESLDQPYERISRRMVRTRDLLAMTDAHGVPRKAVEELLGITNGNARQHVFHRCHEVKEVA